MAERVHSLSTCRIPLSALTYYYRRNLTGDAAPSREPQIVGRRRTVCVAFDGVRAETVVTVAEFAAYVAYLEPLTGIGLLVAPRPETDVVAPDDWFLEVAWSGGWETYRPAGGLSLHSADRAHVLDELDRAGWKLLENSEGLIEPAGRTADGRQAMCLSAGPGAGRPLVLEDLQHAITALHVSADLRHER
ncbi:hypothetical protein GCM10009742_06990 [Kribbella karoonensis]|uniref:Uncharacterized protein n=2 Tax=Kribbellaceae TaxID=2726069 RepID=A0ABP4NW09_9ACTN